MDTLITHVIAWPTVLVVLLMFGFAPGAVLRVIVLAYRRDDPRRTELLGELPNVPRVERPFWVCEQLESALFEGLAGRMAAWIGRMRYGRRGRSMPGQPPGEDALSLIPTRDLVLEWTSRKKPLSNYDASLDQIAINIEGHLIRLHMAQVIRIPAQAAPGLVGGFVEQEDVYGASGVADGAPVRRFVERVLGSTVEGYFQTIATNCTALDFFERFDEIGVGVACRVREALAEWGVEAVSTVLSYLESEDS